MLETLVWPLVVLAIAVVVILVFRAPLSEFLRRSENIKFPGGELNMARNTDQKSEKPVTDSASAEELLRAFDSTLLRDQERRIRDELTEKGLQENAESVRVLIRHLAATQISLAFERFDRVIFGSQVALLHLLNAERNGLSRELVAAVYRNAAAAHIEAYQRFKFEDWLGYLLNRGLVLNNEDKTLSITVLGVEFLAYLTREGKIGSHTL